MPDAIMAYVQNASAGNSYQVSVYDLFGGEPTPVDGSPFNLNPGDKSHGFKVNLDGTGTGMIRCVDNSSGQQLCPDAPVPNNNNNNIVTFPA